MSSTSRWKAFTLIELLSSRSDWGRGAGTRVPAKSDAETRDTHIIAVTSYPDRYKKSDALAAGCDAYLVKPISTRALPGLVTKVAGITEESKE